MRTRCPCCGSADLRPMLGLPSVPVNSCLLLRSREEALSFPVGDIELAGCERCGFVFNAAFDERLTRYAEGYEEAQGYSGTYSRFEQQLVDDLVERFDLRRRTVLEIGCGKGEFLLRLCAAGGNRGIGFDPTFDPARVRLPADGSVRIVRDFYSPELAGEPADLYCCKMTLEHVADAAGFVAMLRDGIGGRAEAAVFVQVPDASRIVRQAAFEDIYYEHCAYFNAASLRRLFTAHGFSVLETRSRFGGQYLTLLARPVPAGRAPPPEEPVDEQWREAMRSLGERVRRTRDDWGRRLAQRHDAGRRIVLWGGGSKAVAFLTAVPQAAPIEFAVDINPYRQDSYLPVTGQRIVAPSSLRQLRPDCVVILNRIYAQEIRRDLEALGLRPELLLL